MIRQRNNQKVIASPPWTGGFKIGMFLSKLPVRPNYSGLNVSDVAPRA
jgi:hypothetical protein